LTKREDWLRLYHKTLKGIEAMIDVQRIVKDMKKMAEETNMTITEIERMILILVSIIGQSIPQTSHRYLKIFDIWFKVT